MAAHDDAGEFIDSDFQRAGYLTPTTASTTGPLPNRPPTREEIEAMVSEKQIKLAELKRAQEELERERAGLEELRRRQIEFHTGREEMRVNLTRGLGLLEEAEVTARRDAEQMARQLEEFRDALSKVQAINEHVWSQENVSMELARASTTIENARMEWNAARLKFPILSTAPAPTTEAAQKLTGNPLAADFLQLCKMGFAFNWPLVLLGLGIFLLLLLRH
jgi:hypothetical protein